MIAQTSLFELSPKEAALQAFEEQEGEWLARIRAAALTLYQATGEPVCTDDLRGLMLWAPNLRPPPDRSMNILGAVFRKGWREVGRTTSKLPQAHSNEVRLWVPEAA